MTAPLRLPVLSSEYVRVSIAAREAGTTVDPTSDTVEMAFVTTGEPGNTDWHTASWENDGATHYARILVGPAGVALPIGKYGVWVRVTDLPEIPVRNAGKLVIF